MSAATHGPLTGAGLFLLLVERVPSCPLPPSPNESIFPEAGVNASVCCLVNKFCDVFKPLGLLACTKCTSNSPSTGDLRDDVSHELEHLPGVDLVVCGVVAELPVPSGSEGEHASFLQDHRRIRDRNRFRGAEPNIRTFTLTP